MNAMYVPFIICLYIGGGVIQCEYRLDERGSIPARGKTVFPVARVQTSSEARPASYPLSTDDLFPA
jgi:hypothetical protein